MISFDLDMSLRTLLVQYGKENIYCLLDENTAKCCMTDLKMVIDIADSNILVLPAGEQYKTIDTVCQIWNFLIDNHATRKSLLINLGGGVITDLGGFAAATFKRGLSYVNIPTTLLAAVDAATGGKTGFNYNGLKNEIGVFAQPKMTIIHTKFFRSLSAEQFLSGYAEMIKHALIASPLELANILNFNLEEPDYDQLEELISRSNEIKNYIVEQDPEENGIRKTLNFGHTVGHALEEYALVNENKMLHGYAVMYGMVAELYLSVMKEAFPERVLSQIVQTLKQYYGKPQCACKDYEVLIELMKHDKKNEQAGQINFTLLHNVGNPRINQICTEKQIAEALDFLFNA